LCFFHAQRWDEAKYWLEQVNLTDKVKPLIYLALVRTDIEQPLYLNAQSLINQYEQRKTW